MRNLLVYAKRPGSKRFETMNIQDGSIGVPLGYATLVPEKNIDSLIKRLREAKKRFPEHHFEIRYAGTSRKTNMFLVGDRVAVVGPVKYGDTWYDVETEGRVEYIHPRGMNVCLDRIDGDALATCYVANRYVSLAKEMV